MISNYPTSFFDFSPISLLEKHGDSSVPPLTHCTPSSDSSSSSSVSSSSSSYLSTHVAVSDKKKKKSRTPSKVKTPLPLDFVPSEYTVLCGRNRECFESVGNQRFRVMCQAYLQDYLDAPGKLEKSSIVTKIMRTIRQQSPVGAFVSYENGRYYEVSQRTAREKVGAFFRDSLHTVYRSSSKAKLARKRAEFTPLPLNELQEQQQQQPRMPSLGTSAPFPTLPNAPVQEQPRNNIDIIDMSLLESIAPVGLESFRDGRGNPLDAIFHSF